MDQHRKCSLTIDGSPYEFEVEGSFFWGEDGHLYKEEDNVISKTEWKDDGYGVVEAFTPNEFASLRDSVRKNVLSAMKQQGIEVDEASFKLEDYHRYVHSNEDHFGVINITRNLRNDDFDFDIESLVKRFSKEVGYPLTSYIEELGRSHIQLRINRPSSLDINPPHKDGYLSVWEDIINVWIPIAGCDSLTSLPVAPGSHLWNEKDIYRTSNQGAKINGAVYNVPCILQSSYGKLDMVRPNPKEGEALIFTPFLVHGAAVNRSNHSRVSMELRFPCLRN